MAIGFKVVWKAAAILNKKQRWKRRIFVIFTLSFSLLNKGNEPFFTSLKKGMTNVKCSTDNAQKKIKGHALL
ncbi:MAG TPA: hypothetical protein VEX65_03395 [Flavisolibacter sp.]|nr:hypothetical protein [Flavisolibacter sp.]